MSKIGVQAVVIIYFFLNRCGCDGIIDCPPLFTQCVSAAECNHYIPSDEIRYLKSCSGGVCCPYNIITPLPTKNVERRTIPEAEDCMRVPNCTGSSRYRTITGSCNNPIDPAIATEGSTYLRLLPAQYDDGVSSVKTTGESGSPLPVPRQLCTTLSPDMSKPDPVATLMVMQWGQYISHDLSETPVIKDEEGNKRPCCENGTALVGAQKPQECIPLEVPQDDDFFAQFNTTCIEMVRSKTAPDRNCSEAVREQFNILSHYLDGSMVYGSTEEDAQQLREYKLGRMKITVVNKKPFLPASDKCTEIPTEGEFCFLGGDGRVNVLAGLTLLHVFWIREHNRIARYLHIINKHWDDEKLYQETRHIVIAEIQHITYNEYLPIVLGEKYMEKYNLFPKRKGYSYDYSPLIDPTVSNEHTTAGFRFGHSQIQGNISLYDEKKKVGSFFLKDNFHPFMLFDKKYESQITRGLYKQSAQSVDPFFAHDVSRMLFQTNGKYGKDLVSINIQRGREHGLPGYNAYRQLCGLSPADTFNDLADVMTPESISKLASLYEHVDDIDLFVAGLMENKAEGSLLGPTFQCIVGDQFFRTKWGDRFFYDLGGRPSSFSPEQLKQIRKVTMARILCDNGDNMDYMQKNVFLKCIPGNSFAYCEGCFGSSSISKMNLDVWKEY